MSSLREQILQAVMETVSRITAPGLDGYVPVTRDPSLPAAASVRWQISLEWKRENVAALTWASDECTLFLSLSVFMRSAQLDDDAREALDGVMAAAHRALMADRTLGGLCQSIARIQAGRDSQQADTVVSEILHGYQIIYRHTSADLEVA
jgi:hypothetical protein